MNDLYICAICYEKPVNYCFTDKGIEVSFFIFAEHTELK